MSCDGLFLHQIHKQIKKFLPAKINKIYLVSDTELLLFCRGDHQNFKLLISTHPQYARMNITKRSYPTPEVPANFTMLLRKHLENGIILGFNQCGLDRVFYFDISARNELGDNVVSRLYVELMGKYANVILCDENNKIVDALKRIPPYENSKRTIWPGAMYQSVELQEKKDPRENFEVDMNLPILKQFHGFSPLLSTEVEFRLHHNESFKAIMDEILNSSSMFIHPYKDDFEYNCIPLKHLENTYQEYDIMEGFDVLFYHKEEKDRIRQQTGDLFKFVKQNLNKNHNKLVKLKRTLEDAYDCDKYRIYGELLYAYSHQIERGASKVSLPDFETNELIEIPLDKKFDGKYNAKKMYQKYNKGKNAQSIVAEQIEICEREIAYFEIIEAQLEQASFDDAKEIRQELASKGYLKQINYKIRKKKNPIPSFSTYEVDGVKIHVGKNNIQNDYLTWKQARKEHIWLHTKDIHGSHVVVEDSSPNETVLRAAANLAAYYSKARNSSSVPVNYAPIKSLKKIPNSNLGLVQLSAYKTIYIDPDETLINTYTKLK